MRLGDFDGVHPRLQHRGGVSHRCETQTSGRVSESKGKGSIDSTARTGRHILADCKQTEAHKS